MKDSERTTAPTLAALERSPEAGRHKRLTKDMVYKCKAAFPQLDVGDNSVVYSGGVEAARYVATTTKWERRRGWDATGVSWKLFEAAMMK